MEDPGLQDVLDFLTKRGFSYAAAALREDIFSSAVDGSDPVLPPVKTKVPRVGGGGFEFASSGTSSGGSDDFVSMGSSPSELRNPYGIWSPSRAKSDDSSDRNSEFRTARDHDFNIFSDTCWYGDHPSGYLNNSYPESAERFRKEENENYDTGELPSGANDNSKHGESYNCLFPLCNCCNGEADKRVGSSVYGRYRIMPDHTEILDEYGEDGYQLKQMDEHHEAFLLRNDSFHGPNQASGRKSFAGRQEEKESKMLNTYEVDVDNLTNGRRECEPIIAGNSNYHDQPSFVTNAGKEERHKEEGCNMQLVTDKGSQQDVNNGDGPEDHETIDNGFQDPGDVGVEGEEHATADDLQLYSSHEDEYEIFDLRVIHRKNRTGFEENKDLPIVLNSVIAGRYYVTEYLGSAAFSKVVQAHDLYTGVNVCLKIIKNDKDFFDQSLDEIKLLKFVNKCDPADEHHILRLYDYFYHQEHLFIVCELLQANLYDYQKYNHDSGGEDYFTLPRIQSVARQCLEALDYLHHLRIIHCDLKPENILMKSYSRCEIKIIDLGSSCFLTDKLCLYVQSRSYRAPEVILGLPYDQKIDIWSLGCILVELYTGEVLFPNDSLPMMLARMIGILGLIDMEMLEMGCETYKYFTDDYDLYNRNEETDQVEYLITEKSSLAQHLEDSDTAFIDFVSCLLQINPKMRPTASQALEHQWLSFPYH